MKKIEVNGLGVYVEVWKRNEIFTDLETLKEAAKTLQREILRYEKRVNLTVIRPTPGDGVQEHPSTDR